MTIRIHDEPREGTVDAFYALQRKGDINYLMLVDENGGFLQYVARIHKDGALEPCSLGGMSIRKYGLAVDEHRKIEIRQ